MSEELRKRFCIPQDHCLILTRTRWDPREGQDAESDFYDEMDAGGNVVGRYMVRDGGTVRPAPVAHARFEKLQ